MKSELAKTGRWARAATGATMLQRARSFSGMRSPRRLRHLRPPAIGTFPGGIIKCPMCSRTFETGPGFMWHLTSMHPGEQLDEAGVRTLRALDRAVCNRCRLSTPLRPLQVGDIIPGPRTGAPTVSARREAELAERAADTRRSQLDNRRNDVALPMDFTTRIRRLKGGGQTHIPIELRVRHATICAETLEGMAEKLPGWTLLEEGRSKLLLIDPPAGVHVPMEIATRTSLWQGGRLEELLSRVEAQMVLRRSERRSHVIKRAEAAKTAKKRRGR